MACGIMTEVERISWRRQRSHMRQVKFRSPRVRGRGGCVAHPLISLRSRAGGRTRDATRTQTPTRVPHSKVFPTASKSKARGRCVCVLTNELACLSHSTAGAAGSVETPLSRPSQVHNSQAEWPHYGSLSTRDSR